jgi:hypothetical protein
MTKSRSSSAKGKANKTRRKAVSHAGVQSQLKSHIVQTFLEMLNLVKLYHWHTHSYPEHKATDELYAHLNEHIDTFVEIMLGKDGSRIHHGLESAPMDALQIANTHQLHKKIEEYKAFLMGMTHTLDASRDSDLLNVRDEILGDLNQFTYLLTLH